MPIDNESPDPRGIADGLPEFEHGFTPNEADRKLADSIMDRFYRAHEARQSYETDWETWRLYLSGTQMLWRDTESGEVVRLSKKDNKRLLSWNNQLRPVHRSLVGKMARVLPGVNLRPATMDYDEIQGAKAGETFIQYFYEKEGLDVAWTNVWESVGTFGNGIAQLYWDPAAGQRKALCPDCSYTESRHYVGVECPACTAMLDAADKAEGDAAMAAVVSAENEEMPLPNPDQLIGQPLEAPKMVAMYEGDLRLRVHDIRDIFVEPGVTEIRDARYIFARHLLPLSEVRRRWPHIGIYVKGESSPESDPYAKLGPGTAVSGPPDIFDEHVTVYEYHEVGTELYPEGRTVFVADNIILEEVPGEWGSLDRLPFFSFHWAKNPGEFWAEGFIAQAWHRQKELNALETTFREYNERCINVPTLIPFASRINVDEFRPGVGNIYKYMPAGPIEHLTPPPLPEGAYRRRGELVGDISFQAGITEQERGVIGTDPNGRAMAILEAEANQQVGPIRVRARREWTHMVKGMLILALKYFSPEKRFAIGGDGYHGETFCFADLKLREGWDVVLEQDDGMSGNSGVRLEQAANLLQLGAFTDPTTGMPDMEAFAQTAKLKLPGSGPDTRQTEYSAATELLKRIENGDMSKMPQPEDDAVVFAKVLLGWLRGKGRQEPWSRFTPYVRQLYQFYLQWAATGVPPDQMLGPPGAGGPGSGPSKPGSPSAPGGSPGQAGGTAPMANVSEQALKQESGQQVQQADQSAEKAGNPSGRHEN